MHLECSDLAQQMFDCFAEHPLKKFVGHCTKAELAFKECNRMQRNRKRKEHQEQAKVDRKKRQQLNKEYQAFREAFLRSKE